MAEAEKLGEVGNMPHPQCATAMNGEKSVIKGNNSLPSSRGGDAGSLRFFCGNKVIARTDGNKLDVNRFCN